MIGALTLPDGARVRGRGLRHPLPDGPAPTFGVYLGSPRWRRRHAPDLPWPHRWVAWPDFGVPTDRDDAVAAVRELHARALAGEDVEVACGGGVGRTGTVLACLAVRAGLGPDDAIAWVRAHHHRRAVETPWQRRWVRRYAEDS